jgi:hypothetical protein
VVGENYIQNICQYFSREETAWEIEGKKGSNTQIDYRETGCGSVCCIGISCYKVKCCVLWTY